MQLPHHNFGARRAVLAISTAIALNCALTGVVVAAILPGSSSQASPSPSPSPTPCPSDPTGVLCQLTGGGQPPGGASPTPQPSPGKQPPPPAPGGGGGAPPGGSSTPPPGGRGAAPTPVPGPSAAPAALVAATFKNAPFLGQLLGILTNPVASQRPDLRHFRVADAAAAGTSGGAGPSGPGAGGIATAVRAGSALAVLDAVLLLALGLGLALRVPATRRRLMAIAARPAIAARLAALPRLRRRRMTSARRMLGAATAAVPLFAVVAAASGGVPKVASPAATASVAGAPVVVQLPHPRPQVQAAAPASQAAATTTAPAEAWQQLLQIERGLGAQHDELPGQEATIARIAVVVAHLGDVRDDAISVAVGVDSPVQLRERLEELVAAHQATASAYQASLEAEYALYRSAAQNPPQRQQLIEAAAKAPQPEVRDAVAYDLSLIQTQLAQEATIAAAEAQLQAVGSLTAAQLGAIRRHQPFIAPLVAPVTQPFGPTDFSLEPPLNYQGTFYPHFHTGLDLAAPLDTAVHAAADGVVLLAASSVDDKGHLVGYGNYVLIAHPQGFVTLYGHLDSLAVKAGQLVHQGEIIGLEGSTGWSTGPHVHFEIRHNGQFLDPAPYLTGQIAF